MYVRVSEKLEFWNDSDLMICASLVSPDIYLSFDIGIWYLIIFTREAANASERALSDNYIKKTNIYNNKRKSKKNGSTQGRYIKLSCK